MTEPTPQQRNAQLAPTTTAKHASTHLLPSDQRHPWGHCHRFLRPQSLALYVRNKIVVFSVILEVLTLDHAEFNDSTRKRLKIATFWHVLPYPMRFLMKLLMYRSSEPALIQYFTCSLHRSTSRRSRKKKLRGKGS
jgi:hypothetical protein